MIREVDVHEAWRKARDGRAVIIDVREAHEWSSGHAAGAKHIPLGRLLFHLRDGAVPRDQELLFICASGNRSYSAAALAVQQGTSASPASRVAPQGG
jgi:rhodanese-related sulfurtransferase